MLPAGKAMKSRVYLRWGAVCALRETIFVSLARSRMLFVLLLQYLCLFSVSIAIQRVGRLFGDSENDPFRLCVVLVTGIYLYILIVVRIR